MVKCIIIFVFIAASICQAQGSIMIQPKLLFQRAPEYPTAAKKLRMEGVVSLNARIGTDGNVLETELGQADFTYAGNNDRIFSFAELERISPMHKTAAKSMIDNAAVISRYWKFSPATIGGEAVEVMIVIPFTYKLTIKKNDQKSIKNGTKK